MTAEIQRNLASFYADLFLITGFSPCAPVSFLIITCFLSEVLIIIFHLAAV